MAKKPLARLIQRITGVHRVHHIWYSYGWKVPFSSIAYFPTKIFGIKQGFKRLDGDKYHDCTVTGVY